MFRRKDGFTVSQAEHSRLSGEVALLLGSYLGEPIEKLAGAIALHDWPHFGGSHADTIEIGRKTQEQQQELVERLAGKLPLDPFAELITRLHWQRLTDESETELRDAINQQRIDQLQSELNLSANQAQGYDRWTDFCDAVAFYLSRGDEFATKDQRLPSLAEPGAWEFAWSVGPVTLRISSVRGGETLKSTHFGTKPDLDPCERTVSLVLYSSEFYPDVLQPTMHSILCRLTV